MKQFFLKKNETITTEFIAFPNPCKSSLTISTKSYDNCGKQSLKIYNTVGQLVKQDSFYGKELVIDTESMDDGIYTIHLSSENNKLAVSKILIQH